MKKVIFIILGVFFIALIILLILFSTVKSRRKDMIEDSIIKEAENMGIEMDKNFDEELINTLNMLENMESIMEKMWGDAPDFELKDIYGKNFKLSNFIGKVIILDFWATWCPPCQEEIPGFNKLYEEYKLQGLEIVGVSLDSKDVSVVKKFANEYAIKYHLVMGNDQIAKNYGGITAIPTTFIIDKNGNIVNKHIGFVSKESFEKEIKKLL
ncbi:MAG: TlpA family protein disulfide reductase [Elusimicrobiota bacterium]|nr:TlpA family protein disulfide reductase [Elusimicrobiota bacterium]